MDGMISAGDRVRLVTFNGSAAAVRSTAPGENYWRLVGQHGEVVTTLPISGIAADRVLVKFDCNLEDLGLHNHNEISHSLWVKRSDLQVIETS